MTSFREVPETEAAGEIAAIYDEIRRTYAVPYVSSLFRHLAIYPGLLPWAWQTLRPALLSGAAQHLAWQRINISGLLPLPPLSYKALADLGINDAGLASIRTICHSFVRVSPVNLIVAAALAGLLGQKPAGTGAADSLVPLKPTALPAALPAVPDMVPEIAMTPGTRAALAVFETELAGETFTPGLYRILAHWPGFLVHLAATLGPRLRDPAVLDACEGVAERVIALAPSVLAALEPPVAPAPLTPSDTQSVLAAIRTYRGTSPQMASFGTLILRSLPKV
ncbi:MAG: hypothetical protein OXF26_13855 [Alphaproteobacteria bacterium]|nr:hypothetical protein [Alphaproteobacteria bacterium]MCY4318159.1 hypothetical protein [Alphaproteobacteria bacterium]